MLVTGCHKFSNLIALEVFDHLIAHLFPPTSSTSVRSNQVLLPRECDIVSHIGGSILSKLRKRYRAHRKQDCEECLSFLRSSKPVSKPGEIPSLTEVLDRGGLTYLNDSTKKMFNTLESAFRDCFGKNTGKMSLKFYQDRVTDMVVFNFNDITSDCGLSEHVKELVLTDIIKLFFKIRCYSSLRSTMQKFRTKKNVSKKQKSLRTSLKTKKLGGTSKKM